MEGGRKVGMEVNIKGERKKNKGKRKEKENERVTEGRREGMIKMKRGRGKT